jgi:NitT/TauT family transport system ATP-binding protein
MLARPEYIGVEASVILRTLEGRLKIDPEGTVRESDRDMMFAREGASIPDPVQAAWLYAQMVRWRQTPFSLEAGKAAQAVFRPDLYEAAVGGPTKPTGPPATIGAFTGPAFDPNGIDAYLAALKGDGPHR